MSDYVKDETFGNPEFQINFRDFGSWVRRIRKKRGYTLRQMALALDKSLAWVSEFENGKRGEKMKDPMFFMLLSDYLNVPLESVLSAANIPNKKYDEKFFAVFQMVRSKSLATRIVHNMNSIQETIAELNRVTEDSPSVIQHIVQTLHTQIIELQGTLKIL